MSSRATLRKRKRQAKQMAKQGRTPVKLPSAAMLMKARRRDSDDSDDDSDEESDDEEEEEEEDNEMPRFSRSMHDSDDGLSDDDVLPAKKAKVTKFTKPTKKTESNASKQSNGIDEVFSVPKLDSSAVSKIDLSISSILDLDDVDDITADQKAALILSKIIFPTDRTLFYQLYWEQNPLHSSRSSQEGEAVSATIGKLFPMKEFKRILKEHVFVPNEDIILYGKSFQTLQNQASIDGPSVLKTFLKSDVKCGIRLLETQKWCTNVWRLASALEFEFQSRVSSQITVQSPEFLGLDKDFTVVDHDQFVLQLEGSSGWDIGEAKTHITDHIVVEDEIDEDNDGTGKSAVGKTSSYFLATGDSLYIPKGRSFRQTSLHPTDTNVYLVLGTNRNRAMHDLMSLVVPQAIGNLAVESKKMRQALPLTLTHYTGVASSETETEENPLGDKRRHLFLQYLEKHIMPLITEQVLDIVDPAVDQMSKSFVMERLPVPLSTKEEKSTAAGFSEAVIFPYTQLRMLRPGIATVAVEDGKIVLYHCMDNARVLFGNDMSPLEFDLDDGPAIETLLKAYPNAVMISDLPHPSEDMEDKVGVAQALFKEGFLVIVDETSKPGQADSDDDDNDNDGSGKLDSLL
eukprot:gene481-318_t